MIQKFEKYATLQCLTIALTIVIPGVKRLKSNNFYVGWYKDIYIYIYLYITYIYLYA